MVCYDEDGTQAGRAVAPCDPVGFRATGYGAQGEESPGSAGHGAG